MGGRGDPLVDGMTGGGFVEWDGHGFSPTECMPLAGSRVPVNSSMFVLERIGCGERESLSLFSVAGWTVPSRRLKWTPMKFSY